MLILITGCPVSELFAALRRFQKPENDHHAFKSPEEKAAAADALKGPLDEGDMKMGRLAWKWMIETGEVSIGLDGKWNHLTFDDIMSLPEEPVDKGGTGPVQDSKAKQPLARPTAHGTPKPTKLPKLRPRVFVDEEVVWRTMTGHGPDFRRVPNLEWKLLLVIGAKREEGIIQGDLVRVTGQDKRSVPKRTDFLSLKGYVAKRTHMVRGTKTSKLWLTKFAPALPAPASPLAGLDMSPQALTKDMEPVFWKNQWVDNREKDGKDEIAYMALGQTIMAIIKAWGTVRIGDLKRKLGIIGHRWQMKVMSKFLRRFDVQGNISYVAATFVGGTFVFKDCVRFERDPSADDWSYLLAAGKKRSQYSELRDKGPTTKLPKKIMRRKKKKAKGKGRPSALSRSKLSVLNENNRSPPSLWEANWVQEKPLANTLTDFVSTGAEEGYTAPEISKATVGAAFRRQIFAHLNSTCSPDIQPSNLRDYQMSSPLKIVNKDKARVFTVHGTREPDLMNQSHEQEAIDPALRGNTHPTAALASLPDRSETWATSSGFGFDSVPASAFLENGASDLTILGRMEPGKPVKAKRSYVRQNTMGANAKKDQPVKPRASGMVDVAAGELSSTAAPQQLTNGAGGAAEPEVQTQTKTTGTEAEAIVTRPTRKRKASQRVSYLDEPDGVFGEQQDDEAPARKRRPTQQPGYVELAESDESDESEVEQDRSNPGVYLGIPGSLNPNPNKKGRPRKSIVLIFRSDKIKDPNYLPGWSAYPKPRTPTPPPVDLISRPRKKPRTPPLGAEPGARVPAASRPQSASGQLAETESKSSGGRNPAQAPESLLADQDAVVQNAKKEPQPQQSAGAAPDTILESELASIGATAATENLAPTKASHVPSKKRGTKSKEGKADTAAKWVCEKCGGEWKNDVGLKYHLEKARVICNPYYAEHPELMAKTTKPVRTSRVMFAGPDADADAARPATSSSNSSSSGLLGADPASRPPRKKTRVDSERTSEPAIPRPVLKQRSILKSRHGVSGVVAPRGVQVSEAAAKATAAAKPSEDSTDAAANLTGFVDNVQNRVPPCRSDEEDVDEDLPYLKQIRAEQARSSRKPTFELSVAPSENHGNQPQASTAKSASRLVGDGDMGSGLPAATNQASLTTFDPHPTEMLEPNAPGAKTMKPGTAEAGQAANLQHPQPPQHAEHTVNGVPPFERPSGDRYIHFEDCVPSEEPILRAFRVAAIIEYLVDVNGGVFQADRAMHWAVLKVYTTEFPGWPSPSMPGCSRAMSDLIAEGKLRRDTLAVKTTRLLWLMVNIVMRPDMNINMKPVQDLRLVLKTVLPDVYIPPPFDPTESEEALFRKLERPVKTRAKGPGRRDHKLPESIAQLTAPFYAEKGMAGIRPNHRVDEDERPAKRRRSKHAAENPEDGTVGFQPKMNRTRRNGTSAKRKRARARLYNDDIIVEPHKLSIHGSHATNPGISSLPVSFFSHAAAPNSHPSGPNEILFYAPNTHLEDDYIPTPEPEECQIDSHLLAASSINKPVKEYEEPVPPTTSEESFTPITALNDVEGTQGAWPSVPCRWFEKNDGSFTMKGWMPDQTELLLENLPKNMEQMAFKITSHCKTEQWEDPDYGDFCTSVDGCRSYELSDIGRRNLSGSIAPHYVYINFSAKPEVSNMAPCELQWDERYEWTLETMPYELLEDDDDVEKLRDPLVISIDPEEDGAPAASLKPGAFNPTRKEGAKRPRKYVRREAKVLGARELKVQRELTPYPQEKREYFRVKGDESLGVDWKVEDTRIAAYVAVSTLMGGISKAMDWGIMMRIFPEAKLSNLRRFWTMIKKERDGFITSLSEKFQDEFLEAYEKGVLSPIDFDNPVAYGEHWLELVKWTLALVVKESIELPASRQQFDAELELVPADKAEMDWRDMYHHWQRSVFNKLQDATSEPASTTLETEDKREDNNVVVARSWIRALCCTAPQKYTPYEIRDKFLTLVREGGLTTTGVNELLESTILDLEHRRIAIKQKAKALSTGRPYKLNEHFARTLDRLSNEDRFTVAAEFKLKLDNAFRKGEAVEIPWRTEDGMVIAAFNLQAYGRVRLEPVERLNIPFGFQPGFYESRKFPKSYYRFEIKVTPTPAYLYNEEIEILQRASVSGNIPGATEDGKLPMWCDFFGKPHRGRWFKMLAGVLFVLATRGAMTDPYATHALKPCFEEFEVEIIRKWGLKQGLLREMTAPGGAATVTEWWWLVVGAPMLEEIVGRDARGAKAGAVGGAETDTGAGEGGTTAGRLSKDQYAQPVGRSRRRGKHRMIY